MAKLWSNHGQTLVKSLVNAAQMAFLDGNQPERLCAPMVEHIEARGGRVILNQVRTRPSHSRARARTRTHTHTHASSSARPAPAPITHSLTHPHHPHRYHH